MWKLISRYWSRENSVQGIDHAGRPIKHGLQTPGIGYSLLEISKGGGRDVLAVHHHPHQPGHLRSSFPLGSTAPPRALASSSSSTASIAKNGSSMPPGASAREAPGNKSAPMLAAKKKLQSTEVSFPVILGLCLNWC